MVARCILANKTTCGLLSSKEIRQETKLIADICRKTPHKVQEAILCAKTIVDSVIQSNPIYKNRLDLALRSPEFNAAVLQQTDVFLNHE